MKKWVLFLTIMMSSISYAECNYSLGIQKVENGYLYTDECHAEVGKKLMDLKDREKQIDLYKEVISLKDLQISKEQQRADLWKNTTFKLEDRMMSIRRWDRWEDWLYFGAGVLVMSAATWGAGQLK
jgi:hypothetical protein